MGVIATPFAPDPSRLSVPKVTAASWALRHATPMILLVGVTA
jgi:hypothetical protein